MESIAIVVMVILGGMGNTPGVILAAILLTCCRKACAVRRIPHDHLLAMIIVLMMTRPQGLLTFRNAHKIKIQN